MRIGRMLGGRYRLDKQVALGGMGSVWRGTDLLADRTVAVKVLHPRLAGDEVFRQRFETEASAMTGLRTSGVVDIYDSGTDTDPEGRLCYLVMEYVAGRSLQD
ncbi:MAG: protein kinase, partial [Stackebrandtia sp.]